MLLKVRLKLYAWRTWGLGCVRNGFIAVGLSAVIGVPTHILRQNSTRIALVD